MNDVDEKEYLLADGFNEAIIGIASRCGSRDCIAYNYEKCIEILMEEMCEEDAYEWMEFNVVGAYVGELTPIFIREIIEDDNII